MALGAESTVDDVLSGTDLSGTTAVVTGAASGLGAVTARALAQAGARVVLAVRDPGAGQTVAAGIEEAVPGAATEVCELDLASLESVRRAAGEIAEHHDALQLLINNAGVMACPLGRTAEGFELQLGTNHLGHFLLTGLLEPLLVAGAWEGDPARVVNLSSRGHQRGGIDWDDPHYRRRPYEKWEAYGQSKTANVLFTVELDRRLRDRGVRAYAVHPGVIHTNLSRHLTRDDFANLASRAKGTGALTLRSPEAGAATTVWAATAPELAEVGGVYLEDCHVADPIPEPGAGRAGAGYAPWALDPASARRLWSWSEEEVGERFDF